MVITELLSNLLRYPIPTPSIPTAKGVPIDSVHVSNSLQRFKGFRKLSEGDVSLYMGNEARARVVGVGLCVIS